MTQYETLLKTATNNEITVFEHYHFDSDRIKGLYCNHNIALNRHLETDNERLCILAEELGHHFTSSGDIIDQSSVENRKQERKARLWASENIFDIKDLIKAYEKGCRNSFEIAEQLGITESFLHETIAILKEKNGLYIQVDGYIIYFDPLDIYRPNFSSICFTF